MSNKKTIGSITSTFILDRILFKSTSSVNLSVLASHEFGHYYMAKHESLEPKLPVIFGFGPISFGYIKTRRGNKSQQKRIGIAGPIGGISASFFSLLLFTLINSNIGILVSLFCMASEIINLLYGPDSKKVFI